MSQNKIARGKFIIFEGTDGCGKTTQTELLRRRITEYTGAPCLFEREPDSRNIVGAVIRSALYGGVKISPRSMAYLHVADRLEHIEFMLPLLESGSHIVCDRYYLSNMAYNSGEGLSVEDVYELNRPCAEALSPDAIVYLDVPPEVTRARRAADRASEEIYDADEKQKRIRNNFEMALGCVAKAEGEQKIIRINAARTFEEVSDEIWDRVRALLFE
jgi:dTMP kinase